ncbi:MAG: DNA polymerase III subunit epsilon [Sphingomonadaceae bacterium]
MREIVFDTETTGLSPADGDRLVEIGCIELVDRIETGRTFHTYFNPRRPMPTGAENVHGLTDAFLSDKPDFTERCEELLDFLEDSKLIAHNAAFDFGFLNHELGLCGRAAIDEARMVCTLALARHRHPGAKHSLDALCARFGVDRSIRVRHGALVDARLLVQIYIELTGGRQIGLSLGGAEDRARAADTVRPLRVPRPPRPHRPSAEELARHAAFVAGIANPLWARTAGRS